MKQDEATAARVLFFGTPSFAVPTFDALVAAGYDLRCVTAPEKPAGRAQTMTPPAVLSAARRHRVPVLQPVQLDETFIADVAAWEPRVAVLAAYGKILPQTLLDVPAHGFLNVHPSLLPRFRGASPVAAAVLAGDAETGVTIMQMDAGIDTGPLLAQERLPLTGAETTGSLTHVLARIGAALLVRVLPDFLHGRLKTTPQNAAGVTYAPRLTKAKACLDWSLPSARVERMVRAFQPWPVAWTLLDGQRLLVHRAAVREQVPQHKPAGTLVDGHDALGVVCGDGRVLTLQFVQREGKTAADGRAFRNGFLQRVGSVLGTAAVDAG